MGNEQKPDVAKLMQEIEAAARAIESEGEGGRARAQAASMPRQVPALEPHWDVWDQPAVVTHRGWRGLPVVWLKRAMLVALRPHTRELLKRQREFNRAAKDEIAQLRHQISVLSTELRAIRTAQDEGGK